MTSPSSCIELFVHTKFGKERTTTVPIFSLRGRRWVPGLFLQSIVYSLPPALSPDAALCKLGIYLSHLQLSPTAAKSRISKWPWKMCSERLSCIHVVPLCSRCTSLSSHFLGFVGFCNQDPYFPEGLSDCLMWPRFICHYFRGLLMGKNISLLSRK